MSQKRGAVGRTLLVFVVVVAIVVGAVAFSMFPIQQSKPSESSTSTGTPTIGEGDCGLSWPPSAPDYPPSCGSPLSYTAFQQFVNESTVIKHQDGGITLTVGYHPCTIWPYVLPNATDVLVYLGTLNASEFCA
jgi:hypothetical protein